MPYKTLFLVLLHFHQSLFIQRQYFFCEVDKIMPFFSLILFLVLMIVSCTMKENEIPLTNAILLHLPFSIVAQVCFQFLFPLAWLSSWQWNRKGKNTFIITPETMEFTSVKATWPWMIVNSGVVHWRRHEFEKTLGDSEGQGSVVCCRPWGHKDLDTSDRLNNSNTVSFTLNPRYCLGIPLFRTLRS